MHEPDTKPAVVVVGSTGLIGSHLVNHLSDAYRVFAMDLRQPDVDLPEGAEFIPIDVTSDDRVQEAMSTLRARCNGPFASVIHLAAYYDFSGEPSELYEKVTLEGTRRVLHAARALNAEQFVYSSTMLVHAPTEPGRPLNEDQPLEAKWPYPQSKIATEDMIAGDHGALPAVLLRIAGVYSDTCDSLPLSRQIIRIQERQLTAQVYPGDTSRGQAFVHLDDLVEAMRLAVERRDEFADGVVPILIGEPQTPSYDTLQREFARLLHGESDWHTSRIPKTVAKSGAWLQEHAPGIEDPFIKPWMVDLADDHYELDITRARQLLGWQPQNRVLDSLSRMIKALRTDPDDWYPRHGLDVPEHMAAHNESSS